VYMCLQVSYAGDVCVQVSYAGDVCVQVSYAGDVYRLSFGVRTVHVNSSQILVNGHPFYCVGVGKHEDSDVSLQSHLSLSLLEMYRI